LNDPPTLRGDPRKSLRYPVSAGSGVRRRGHPGRRLDRRPIECGNGLPVSRTDGRPRGHGRTAPDGLAKTAAARRLGARQREACRGGAGARALADLEGTAHCGARGAPDVMVFGPRRRGRLEEHGRTGLFGGGNVGVTPGSHARRPWAVQGHGRGYVGLDRMEVGRAAHAGLVDGWKQTAPARRGSPRWSKARERATQGAARLGDGRESPVRSRRPPRTSCFGTAAQAAGRVHRSFAARMTARVRPGGWARTPVQTRS